MEIFLERIPDVLWYAIIISFFSAVSPLSLAYLTNKHTRRDRAEDWARQDAVAAKAAHTADLLVTSNLRMADQAAVAAHLLLEDNKKVAATAAEAVASAASASAKLDTIHTLVNSQMTAAIQSELDAVQRELVLMLEVVAMRASSGAPSNGAAAASVVATKAKIAELTATLKERLEATTVADAAAKKAT